MSPPEYWRLLPYHCGESRLHIALSQALVRHVRQPTVWWHSTDRPTMILGAGQQWNEMGVDGGQRSVNFVQREAGGSAVLAHSGVLGLDVALPSGHPLALPDVVEAYHWLGGVWVDALSTLGVPARLVGIAEARASRAAAGLYADVLRAACFGTLSPYEVVVGERKLVGLAQVRRRTGVLLQAGIHLHFDAAVLASLLAPQDADGATAALARAALGLDEAGAEGCDEPSVMKAFGDALERKRGVTLMPGEWTTEELRQGSE